MREALYSEMSFHLGHLPDESGNLSHDHLFPEQPGMYFAFLNLTPRSHGEQGLVIAGDIQVTHVEQQAGSPNLDIVYAPVNDPAQYQLTICGSMGSVLYKPSRQPASTIVFKDEERVISGGLITSRLRETPSGFPTLDVRKNTV